MIPRLNQFLFDIGVSKLNICDYCTWVKCVRWRDRDQ